MKTFGGLAVQRLVSTMKRISDRPKGRSAFNETKKKEEDLRRKKKICRTIGFCRTTKEKEGRSAFKRE